MTKHHTQESQEVSPFPADDYKKDPQKKHHLGTVSKIVKVKKNANIRNRYNQVPHLAQDTRWQCDKTQENITRKAAKRSALSELEITRMHQQTGQHNKNNHET